MHFLLVEDDVHFAMWVKSALLLRFPALQITHATSCAQARSQLQALPPAPALALAIVDLNLPDGSGIGVIQALVSQMPVVPVLVVTAVEQAEVALAAIRAGATGYIIKSTINADLVDTVLQVLNGGSPITPAIARLLLQEFRHQAESAELQSEPERSTTISDAALDSITPRETEVLQRLARGYSNKEIAHQLVMSAGTVDTHVRNIYRKLSVNSRAQLRRALGS